MKLNINSARKGNSSYTFSPLTLTTLDYGRLQATRCFSVLPGDDFSEVVAKGLLRCTPQVFPPFGRMNLKSAAFFVPDSQLFSWSTAFHANSKQWRGQPADFLPCFESYIINSFFFSFSVLGLSTLVSANPTSEPARNSYHFSFPASTSSRTPGKTNLNYYSLTPLGFKVFSLLKALGYDFVTFPEDQGGALNYTQHLNSSSSLISAVPFLAYCKVWNDYFCNTYHSDQNGVSDILQSVYLNKSITVAGNSVYDSTTGQFTHFLFYFTFSLLNVPFESNLYTNAWNSPNDPTGLETARINQVNSQSLISPFGTNTQGEFASLATGLDRNIHASSSGSYSQLGHRTLEAFDRFVRRRGLVGSKAVQQIYALFGALPGEWTKDYVVKLCESSNRVQFSAITSSSDTQNGSIGKPLGDFAGTGLGGFDMNFSYKSDTFGTILCLAWLNIDPIIMRGLSPDVLRIKPLDFYSPDYDGKAYRPIPFSEITGGKSIVADNENAKTIYGYTNMYDDYRNMRDVVAGSFIDDTTQHFAFMRDFTETRNNMASVGNNMFPQSSDVQYWKIDGDSDLTNPFIADPSLGDRFWFCVDWNIKCTRPILSCENSFDLDGEGSIAINRNGDGMA